MRHMQPPRSKMDHSHFMTSVRIRLIRNFPFYGSVLIQCPLTPSESIPTMAVGKETKAGPMIKMFFNRDWIDRLDRAVSGNEQRLVDHFLEVMKHETLHLVFGHLYCELPDRYRQTIACELAVNSYVDRSKLISEPADPSGKPGKPAKSGKPDKSGIFPEDFGMAPRLGMPEYYRLLEKNPKFQQMQREREEMRKAAEELGEALARAAGDGTLDDHSVWEAVSGDPMAKETIRDIVRQAADICKKTGSWGDVPGEVMECVEDAFVARRPAIPWRALLRDFVASSYESALSYTMRRTSRRYGTRPGTMKEDRLRMAVGIDTSASISGKALEMFFKELKGIESAGADVTVFEWDTKIQREYPLRKFDGTVAGRGGTDPSEFLSEIGKRKFDCAVVFTDLGFDKQERLPGIPLMWVLDEDPWYDNGNLPVPRGAILKMDGDSFAVLRRA